MKQILLYLVISAHFIVRASTTPLFDPTDTSVSAMKEVISMKGPVTSVSEVGDINKDGINDLVIGASAISTAYVVFGRSSGLTNIDLTTVDLSASKKGFKITGQSPGDLLGASVSGAGDLNHDGIDDFVISAHQAFSTKGAAYVVFGRSSGFANIDLTTADLSASGKGFIITGESSGDLLGASVSGAGDLNHDGIDDLVISASGAFGSRGAVYVVFGSGFVDMKVPNDLHTFGSGFTIIGNTNGVSFGDLLSVVGDLNNDGIDDFVICATKSSASKGAVFVVFGKTGGSADIDLSTTDLHTIGRGFKIIGSSGDLLGSSVGRAGDINNDGIDDLVIGAAGSSSNKGAAYVLFGKTGGFVNIDLATIDLSTSGTGFKITGQSSGDYFGCSVGGPGDLNNDGIDDLVIGAGGFSSNKGAAYVVFGKTGALLNIDLATDDLLTSRKGFQITGKSSSDKFGWLVSRAGDLNNDTTSDLVIGASAAFSGSGGTYIVFNQPVVITNAAAPDASPSTLLDRLSLFILYYSSQDHNSYLLHSHECHLHRKFHFFDAIIRF